MSKRLLLTLPVAMFPYSILGALALIFFSSSIPQCAYIMTSIFQDNALTILLAILIILIVSFIASLIFLITEIHSPRGALSSAKTALVLKLCQIPAYVLIYVLAVIFVITIFTIPFSIALFFIDCATLMMTAFFQIPAIVQAKKENLISKSFYFWSIVLQFVFCADVITSIVVYRKIKSGSSLPVTS